MLIKPEIQKIARIKVVGVGGCGNNAVRNMMEEMKLQGVEFIAVNTDAQALSICPAPVKIQIGKKLTHGLGCGGNPELGCQAAEESAEELHQHLGDADMVFIAAGLSGGTGTGAAPVVADIARGEKALTIAVVTKPFQFEGAKRMMKAEEGIEALKEKVDTLIIIRNQRLLEVTDRETSLLDAFKLADGILGHSVQGISDIIVTPGLVNRDFADVRSVMENAGSALMGIGYGTEGDDRAALAAKAAIESPLLETSIDGAKGVLFNIVGGPNLTLSEVNQAAEVISKAADPDAHIIFGATIDEDFKDKIKITVIATGFDRKQQMVKRVEKAKEEIFSPPEEEAPELETPAFMRRK